MKVSNLKTASAAALLLLCLLAFFASMQTWKVNATEETFGNTATGGNTQAIATLTNEIIRGSKFNITKSGRAKSITAALYSVGNSQQRAKCAIYFSSNLSLVASTQEVNISTLDYTVKWFTFNFSVPYPTLTANTEYVLCAWADYNTTSVWLSYTSGSTSQGCYQFVDYGSWPDPLSPAYNDYQYSVYCSFEPFVQHSFGYLASGGYLEDLENTIRGVIATINETGTADSVTVRLTDYGSGWVGNVSCAIYKRSDLSLVASTQERELTLTSTKTWYTFNITGTKPTLIANTQYVIVAWAQSVAGYCYIAVEPSGTNLEAWQTLTYTGSFPNPLVPNQYFPYQPSIYCTYTCILGSSNVAKNTTIANASCTFSAEWKAPAGVSGYIFGSNISGAFTNDTWVSLGDVSDVWSNVTKTNNATIGVVTQWRMWANDTDNVWADTGLQSFTTTGYALNLRTLDNSGNAITSNCNISITYSGSEHNVSVGSGGWYNWTNTFTYGVEVTNIKVLYENVWVNGSWSVSMTSDKTIDVSCNVYVFTPQLFKWDLTTPLSNGKIRFTHPNATTTDWLDVNSTASYSISQAPNGTWLIEAQYQGSKVNETSYLLAGNVYQGDLKVKCQVWNLNITANDAAGAALTASPTNITFTYSNDTSVVHNSTDGTFTLEVFNGTCYYQVKYQDSWVSANTTLSLTDPDDANNQTQTVNCWVYSLTVWVTDIHNEEKGGSTLTLTRSDGYNCTEAGLSPTTASSYNSTHARYVWSQLANQTSTYSVTASLGGQSYTGTTALTSNTEIVLTLPGGTESPSGPGGYTPPPQEQPPTYIPPVELPKVPGPEFNYGIVVLLGVVAVAIVVGVAGRGKRTTQEQWQRKLKREMGLEKKWKKRTRSRYRRD
jgi:hypothetical protein